MHGMFGRLIPFVALTLLAACGEPCTTSDVQARLDAAVPGSTVAIGACVLSGSLTIPAGVTLRAPGARLTGAPGTSAVVMESAPGAATGLEGLAIQSDRVGLEARGDGEVLVSDVTVGFETGVGVISTATTATFSDVVIRGSVDETNRDEARWLSVTSATAPTHGVVVAAGTARLERVTVEGTAWSAVSAGDALVAGGRAPISLSLVDSTVGRSLGIGVSSSAAQLTLVDTTIDEVWSGVRGWPSYALLLVDGEATTMGTAITNADGYGLVEVAGRSSHASLVIEHVGDVGAWFGRDVVVSMLGGGTRIADTGFAAVLAVDAAEVSLVGATIDGVRALRRTVGVGGAIEVGDGIDAIGTPLVLRDVSITGAARAGLVLDGAGGTDAADLTRVTVTSEGAGLGAVQGSVDRGAEVLSSMPTAGWDVGITRLGAALDNDAAFAGSLPVAVAPVPPSAGDALGVVAPMY